MINKYLERIGLEKLPAPTCQGLEILTRSHSFNVAFENLDALARNPIRIDLESITNKILNQGRGGYCYEVNGILAYAMSEAGFKFQKALCRVTYKRAEPGPKTHLVFIVETEKGPALVDVGFGGPGLVAPMPFKANAQMFQNGTEFRLVPERDGSLQLQRLAGKDWQNLYIVTNESFKEIDLEVANHFVSTWERSPFRSMLMCVLPVENGLKTIQGKALVHLNENLEVRAKRDLKDAADLHDVMTYEFKVKVALENVKKAWENVV